MYDFRVKTGTLVDATIIASASERERGLLGQSIRAGLLFMASRPMSTPTLTQLWSRRSPSRLPTLTMVRPVLMLSWTIPAADSAYRGNYFGYALRAKGGAPRIVATGMWGRDEAEIRARLEAFTQRERHEPSMCADSDQMRSNSRSMGHPQFETNIRRISA